MRTKPGPRASERPTPREIKVLAATEDGCSLKEAGMRLGMDDTAVSSILTAVYTRLGVKDHGTYWSRKERRTMAIDICKRNGWWPQ